MQSLWLCQWVEAFRSIFSTLDLAVGQWGGWKGVLRGQQNGSYVWRSSPLGLQLPTQVLGDASMVSLGTTVPGIEADVSSARYYPCCTLIGVHWHLELYLDHIYPWSLSVQLIRKKQTRTNYYWKLLFSFFLQTGKNLSHKDIKNFVIYQKHYYQQDLKFHSTVYWVVLSEYTSTLYILTFS